MTGAGHDSLKRLQQIYFPVSFEKFLKTPILNNTSKRLLLKWVDFEFRQKIKTYLTTCTAQKTKFSKLPADLGKKYWAIKLLSDKIIERQLCFHFLCSTEDLVLIFCFVGKHIKSLKRRGNLWMAKTPIITAKTPTK